MSFNKIGTIIIEDEELPRQELINALKETDEFEVLGFASSVEEGIDLIKSTHPTLCFLDIKLRGRLSFSILNELLKENINLPSIVINTGVREFEYAKKLFNDYRDEVIYLINKPFWENWIQLKDRILDAYLKHQRIKNEAFTPINPDFLNLTSGKKSYHLKYEDIYHVGVAEKSKGVTGIYMEKTQIECSLSLSYIHSRLPANFVQINRFEIINIHKINIIEHSEKSIHLRNGHTTFIGHQYYKVLCEKLKV